MPRLSFFGKLYVGYAVLVVTTAAALGLLVTSRVDRDSRRAIRQSLDAEVLLLAELVRPALARGRPVSADRLDELTRSTGLRFAVLDGQGGILIGPEGAGSPWGIQPEILEARRAGMGRSVRASGDDGVPHLYAARRIDGDEGPLGFAVVAYPLAGLHESVAAFRRTVLGLGLAAASVALVLGFVLARRFTSPVVQITQAVREFAGGNDARRILFPARDEMGELARAFNTMAAQLQDRMEEVTRDRNQLLAVLGSMVEGVVAVDREERILHLNEVARRILGVDPGRQTGGRRTLGEVTRAAGVVEAVTRCLQEEREVIGETEIPGRGGSRQVEIYGSPLRGGAGRVSGAVVVLHDVTRLRHLQNVRRDFVANASHELKTPITAIRGLVETLLDDPEMPAETRMRFLDRIRGQVRRLSALVSDLLTLSRLEDGLREDVGDGVAFDLRDVARESLRGLAAVADARGIALHADLSPQAVSVLGDPADFRLVVDNLLDNAIKYTPGGGRVDVRVVADAGTALLEVRDTGVGIEPIHQTRIFERFYRVDKARSRELGSTGLGLAIVKHIVQTAGGAVRVESTPGSGSTFQVRIPLAGGDVLPAE